MKEIIYESLRDLFHMPSLLQYYIMKSPVFIQVFKIQEPCLDYLVKYFLVVFLI